MRHTLLASATHVLQEIEDCLVRLTEDQFARPLPILHGNSVGRHVRHMLEFFQCLDQAVETGLLNYDLRTRNLRMETEPAFTCLQIRLLMERIAGYSDAEIQMEVDYGLGITRIQTTVFRELVYNIEHSVHHQAILKIGIETAFPQVEMPDHLGVAYSTQVYQQVHGAG
jgi:hypothetical protein